MYKLSNVKSWFIKQFNEKLSQTQKSGISLSDDSDGYVVRETEKAVCLKFDSDYGSESFWFPKSVFMTDEEADAEFQNAVKRFENGKSRYNKLVAFAKENNLKIRNRMKAQTILNIIQDANLEYAY